MSAFGELVNEVAGMIEPPAEFTIAHDQWEIAHGDVDAFRARWGMDDLADMDDGEKRRLTSREYVTDILGIDHDG